MMADTISLTTRPQAIQQGVIDILEEALRRARSGEITDVAIATIYSDGKSGARANETDQRIKLIGAVYLMLKDLSE